MGLFVRLAALSVCAIGSFAAASTIPDPVSTKGILEFIRKNEITRLEDVLAALPKAYRENFTLVHTSKSLQEATKVAPRLIMFGLDARMIMAVGSVNEDARSKVIEIAELEPEKGLYHYQTLTFGGPKPTHTEHPTSCQRCHGNPARPIWGQYPFWPGVYGNDRLDREPGTRTDNRIPENEWPEFEKFWKSASTHPHYRHLKLNVNEEHQFFALEKRNSSPNTTFNTELVNNIAQGTFTRLRQHPRYRELRGVLLASMSPAYCWNLSSYEQLKETAKRLYQEQRTSDAAFAKRYPETGREDENLMLFRLLGIDRDKELQLHYLVTEVSRPDTGMWNSGEELLGYLIGFLVLEDIKWSDMMLGDLFSRSSATSAELLSVMRMQGEERARAKAKEFRPPSVQNDIFGPVTKDETRRQAVCERLMTLSARR